MPLQERIKDLIMVPQKGELPVEEVQLDLPDILRRRAVIQRIVDSYIQRYRLDPVTRRDLVRARLNQILLEGSDKDALMAARIIANDPEVGLNTTGATTVNVGVFSPDVKQLLESLDERKEVRDGTEHPEQSGRT